MSYQGARFLSDERAAVFLLRIPETSIESLDEYVFRFSERACLFQRVVLVIISLPESLLRLLTD